MKRSVLIAAMALAGLGPMAVQAQFLPHPHARQDQSAPQQVDCAQLAQMPNAPMSQATCEQMMQMQQTYQTSSAAGARPGDEDMTCAQINAETATMQDVGVTAEHRQQAKTAGHDYQAAVARGTAEANAAMMQEQAEDAPLAAAAGVTGNAGGGALAAKMAADEARNRALSEKIQREEQPYQSAATQSAGAAAGDLTASMQSNPRFARLMQLAGQKHCR